MLFRRLLATKNVEESLFGKTIEHGVRHLVNDERSAQAAEDLRGFGGLCWVVIRNAHVERFSQSDGLIKGQHRLFQRRIRIGTVGIKDVDVFEAHTLEALVETRQKILP